MKGTLSRTNSHRASGFSLVELMIAMVLGLILIAGVLQLFAGSKATYQANETLARVQENVRFALGEMQFNSRGLTNLGFCGTRPVVNQFVDVVPGWQEAVFGANQPVVGWEFAGTGLSDTLTIDADYNTAALGSWSTQPRQLDGTTPALDLPALFAASADIRPVADSDVFVTRTLIPLSGVTWGGGGAPGDVVLGLDGPHGLAEGDLALVTDCQSADLFRNRATGDDLSRAAGGGCDGCPGNVAAGTLNWSVNLTETLQAYRVQIWAYFVGFNSVRGEPG